MNGVVSTLASFAVCALVVVFASEVFYRLVDLPSIAAAKKFWAWMVK